VRAQKESIDLISFIANSFVDLVADVANNVCLNSKKKNIFPEHTYQAIKELHLEDYFPFLLQDNQNLTLKDILLAERSSLEGIDIHPDMDIDEGWQRKNGVKMTEQLLKRLSQTQSERDKERKRIKKEKREWMKGLSAEEIKERHRQLFENFDAFNDDENN